MALAAMERSRRRRTRSSGKEEAPDSGEPLGEPTQKRSRRRSSTGTPQLENEGCFPEENGAAEADSNGGTEELSRNDEAQADSNGDTEEHRHRDDEATPDSGKRKVAAKKKKSKSADTSDCCFVGEAFSAVEAKQRWPHRYQTATTTNGSNSSGSKEVPEIKLRARFHYKQAEIDGCKFGLEDCAYVKAEEGAQDFICRIEEFFKATDGKQYFTARWFYREVDTAIKDSWKSSESRRVFLSEIRDVNPLGCIVSKVDIACVEPNVNLKKKEGTLPKCDLYYDMSYSVEFSTFANLPLGNSRDGSPTSILGHDMDTPHELNKSLSLLDLYSGCGAMSTGLCLGAKFGGANLETRWAVDYNEFACESFKKNHQNTEVRNEDAESFLTLLVEWEKLCRKFSLIGTESSFPESNKTAESEDDEQGDTTEVPKGEFEVDKLVGICYGDRQNFGKVGLKFKVRWKGYDPSYDTWEPADGLSKCQERIKDFVQRGYKRNLLPLPGTVDVICGGPPCQGISGYNRFRETKDPLKDSKNKQAVVYMDIVEFLKPKYILMENVVDLLRLANGFLGRYALGRLVSMNYQARIGLIAAGGYGLPQFRRRVFIWGALPTVGLPQFPLPTHEVVSRGCAPNEFEQNIVACSETQARDLEKALFLEDAISDLPPVTNNEEREEIPYGGPSKTDFQRFIRLSLEELASSKEKSPSKKGCAEMVTDHRPYICNEDDYLRVCQIPKRKGANFRDLPGVKVNVKNVVEWDPKVDRVYLPSGKPLVPDYAMSFIKGKSSKPFRRLWWDETVPTVVTRPEPHNQAILHPIQDRVLTIRENARLQGFPDNYKFAGPIKERYMQVGNAVAVPVARALGCCLARAMKRKEASSPLCKLPSKFCLLGRGRYLQSENSESDE